MDNKATITASKPTLNALKRIAPNPEFCVPIPFSDLVEGQQFHFGWFNIDAQGIRTRRGNGFDCESGIFAVYDRPDEIVFIRPERNAVLSTEVDG
jgi:hypothetical protein